MAGGKISQRYSNTCSYLQTSGTIFLIMKFCLAVFQNGTSSCGKSKSIKIFFFFSLKMFSRVFSVS